MAGNPLSNVIDAETLVVQPEARMSERLKRAIALIVVDGKPRTEAAQIAGMHPSSLDKALRRPAVIKFKRDMWQAMTTAAGQQAYRRMVELSQAAGSEHVSMESSKWVAGVAGIGPTEKHQHQHQHSGQVGIVLDLRGDGAPELLDVTPERQVIEHQRDDRPEGEE